MGIALGDERVRVLVWPMPWTKLAGFQIDGYFKNYIIW